MDKKYVNFYPNFTKNLQRTPNKSPNKHLEEAKSKQQTEMGLWDGFASGLWRRTYERLPYIFNRDEDNLMSLVRGFAAEFFGMCVWIFLACGSVPAVEATLGTLSIKPDSLLVISISFGVGICIPIYMFAEISGANFNPAVSFSLWLLQRQSFIRLCIYIVAQLSGSILAACLLRFVITNAQDHVSALGATHIAPGIDWVKGMYIETLLTSILIFCVVGTAVHPFGRTVHHKEKWSHLGAGVNTGVVVGMIIFALNSKFFSFKFFIFLLNLNYSFYFQKSCGNSCHWS